MTLLETCCEDGAQLGAQTVVFGRSGDSSAMSIQEHSDGRRKAEVYELARHIREPHKHSGTGRDAKLAFRYVQHTRKHGSAACEYATSSQCVEHTALAEALFYKIQKLACTWFKNFSHGSQRQSLRVGIGNLYLRFDGHSGHNCVAVLTLQFLSLRHRHLQTYSQIVGKVCPADRNRGRVRHCSFKENCQVTGVCSNVENANPEFALVGRERGLSSGDRFEYGLRNFKPRPVCTRNGALECAARACGNVEIHLKTRTDHAYGVENTGLIIEDELARKQVENLAIRWALNRTCSLHGSAHIFAGDFAHPAAEIETTVGVEPANMRTAYADHALIDVCPRNPLR